MYCVYVVCLLLTFSCHNFVMEYKMNWQREMKANFSMKSIIQCLWSHLCWWNYTSFSLINPSFLEPCISPGDKIFATLQSQQIELKFGHFAYNIQSNSGHNRDYFPHSKKVNATQMFTFLLGNSWQLIRMYKWEMRYKIECFKRSGHCSQNKIKRWKTVI